MAGSIKLAAIQGPVRGEVDLPISKSIANRALILSALSGQKIELKSTDVPDDVRLMAEALQSSEKVIELQNAGTAMRFLTAYFSIQEGREVILTGNKAMQQRPITDLVNALRAIGADITYDSKEGFPPLRIKGKELAGGSVELSTKVSSQFVSALMLIGSFLDEGMNIRLNGKSVSSSYIDMTKAVIQGFGGEVSVIDGEISIQPSALISRPTTIENDWSAASYFYAIAALKPGSKILLKGLKLHSIQGDGRIAEIMNEFGVESKQSEKGVELISTELRPSGKFRYDLNSEPDLVQTLACFHAARGDEVSYFGIDHLRYKETDRLAAIQAELRKFSVRFEPAEDGWVQSGKADWNREPIATFGDHRMAMAFCVLATRFQGLQIEEPTVVSKSFPSFWTALSSIGFTSEP